MKKTIEKQSKRWWALLLACLLALEVSAQTQDIRIIITGDFESLCVQPVESLPGGIEEPPVMAVACQGRTVHYTAYAGNEDEDDEIVSWTWEVYGATSTNASGNAATVVWDYVDMGEIAVTATTASGRTSTRHQTVRLVENPVASATTTPAWTGDRIIYVCTGEDVEFTDQSEAGNSDIAGYYWLSPQGEAGTRTYTLRNVTSDCEVVHRVYNNCGCYDEETYTVIVLEGAPLTLSCYGTVCEGSTATYHALSPVCSEYYWSVEGGHIVNGQGTADITVLWDAPHDGYGMVSLDGTLCGNGACQNQLSVRIPIIQDRNTISGQTAVCAGEAVTYRVPLYGSTEYLWDITPAVGSTFISTNGANEMIYRFDSAGTYVISVRYRCDFLSCGPFESEPLTVVVKPRLSIQGAEEVCLTRNETYSTNAVDPDTMMTWTVTDLATGQTVYTSSAPEAHYGTESELPAGRYLITAQNPAYCNVAEFVLTVKDPPPAPTVDDMDPANPTIACRNSAILLKASTDNPYGTFVWVPGCASATPDTVMGDEVSVIYGNEVCDIDVYAYDRQLGCRSSGPYVHHVGAFVLSPTTLPQTLRVCPGTEVDWTGCVPYQEGVIYDWEIEENKQYCATLKSTPDNNSVWLQINELDPPVVYPVTFAITLTRTYCSGLKDIQRVQVTIADLHTDLTINVDGGNPLCQGGSVRLSCPNCTGSSTWNVGGTLYANSVPDPYTLNRTGDVRVTLECNPYDYCTNSAYLSKGETTIHVNPLPTVLALGCDGTEVYTIPPLNTGDYSFRWSHTGTDNWKVRVASGQSQYSCTVTDRTTGCSTTLTTECGGCDRMTIVDDGYDYCTREARFHVVGATGRVDWTIVGSPCGTPTYSGTNNSRIFIPVNEVGTYALFAHVDGNPCYSADTYFTVDFIPEFAIERKCTDIVIRNYSQYLDGSRTVTFLVDGTSCTFPVSDRSYIVRPSTTGTHTVTLTMYDGRPLTGCISETLTTVNSEGRVTITSDNVDPAKACDNTAVLLRSSVSSGADITASNWHFGDNSHYSTAGDNVYHTFEGGFPYIVTATVTDENGCVSIGNVSIESSSNNLEQPSLYTSNQTVCPGTDKLIEYYVNGDPVPADANNYYTWRYPVVNNQSSTHYVQSTGDYSVFVTNDNSCIAEAATNVPFKNKPTAIIIPSKYYYCLGETVELYGEPSFGDTYTYNWTVTNTATNAVSVYTGQSVSFTVDDAVRTIYAIDLTVTNSENCPDDAEQVEIVAVGQLEAPHIDFSDEHYCIGKEPVKLVCDGPVTGVHWSNGDYGPGATYYYPTTANAYYYDEESGCRSDMARIYIPAAPDFDGLLTGCYKVCPAKMEAMLPVYGLFPYWQRFDYNWYRDNSLIDNDAGVTLPRWLPLGGYGQYVLDVTYFQDCVEQSKPLVLEEDTKCKCDSVSIEIKQEYKCTEKCELEYTFDVTVCNNSSNTICFDKLVPLFDITSGNITITTNTFIPTVLPPGGCVNFIIGLTALTLDPMSVAFQLEDNDCAGCTKDFGLDLTPKVDCNMEVSDGDIDPNGMMSGSGVYYYDFSIILSGVQSVFAVWSTPQQVLNYTYDGIQRLDGLCAFDINDLDGADSVCIDILVCVKGKLCIYTYCVETRTLLNGMKSARGGAEDQSAGTTVTDGEPQLRPNPTTGEVEVVGTTDKVTEVLVLDMNGRKMAEYQQMSRFDVSDLPAGFYIVRLKTLSATDEKVSYVKLVKR